MNIKRNIILTLIVTAATLLVNLGRGFAAPDGTGIRFTPIKVLVAREVDDKFNAAKPSGQFLCIILEAQNIGNRKIVLTHEMFSLVINRGLTYKPTDRAMGSIEFTTYSPLTACPLAPGQKISFNIAFDLPASVKPSNATLKIQPTKKKVITINNLQIKRSI